MEFSYSPTRAQEVEYLIKVAMDCGHAKNTGLFDRMLYTVYGNKKESLDSIQNIAETFSKMLESLDNKENKDEDCNECECGE